MKYVLILTLLFFTSCSQKSKIEIQKEQNKINKMAQITLNKLMKKEKKSVQDLDKSIAYMVLNFKTSKIPVFGIGSAYGVLVNTKTNTNTYVKVKEFEIGAGWGVRSFKQVFFIYDKKLYDNIIDNGKWKVTLGAEATAGTLTQGTQNKSQHKEFSHYTLLDGGGSATFTLKISHLKLNKSLNQ